MTTDELNVKLTADIGNLTQRLNEAEREIRELGDTTENATEKASAGFNNLKAAVAGLGLGAIIKKTITSAGELEQNLGGSEAVFKSFALTIQDSASKAYSTLGLSQSQYLATANKMGALFQGSGFTIAESVDLTTSAMQRAADVASIMGVEVNSAMDAVAGAAKGNFTMMDNLGVAINDTTLQIYAQEKGLGKLETTQQKVNAAMQMFIEKTDYAAGNYAKENETFAGSLQTLKAELENLAATAGTELLPAATQGIATLSIVVSDLSPVITSVASGLGAIGQVLQLLENPAARGIAYAVAATVAINKLKLAVGSTASGLILLGSILTYILGKYAESQKATDEAVSSGMDGAITSTDAATKSTDKLTESLGNAEKAASRLAGFDEITKLSGGSSSTLASSLVSSDDILNIEAATDGIEAYQNAVSQFDGRNLTDIDWSKLKEDIESLGNDILTVFTGTETESYQALRRLNDRIALLFGEEWVDFWGDVGKDIYDVFNGAETESYNALKRLNDRIEELPFGETFSEFFQKVGANFHTLFEGIEKAISGDFAGAAEKFGEFVENNGKNFKDVIGDNPIGNAYETVAEIQAMPFKLIAGDKETKDKVESVVYKATSAVDDFMTNSASVISPFTTVWSDVFQDVGAWIYSKTNTSEISDPPLSATDMFTLTSGTPFMGPIQLNATFNVDGEKMGEAVASYNDGQVSATNGR